MQIDFLPLITKIKSSMEKCSLLVGVLLIKCPINVSLNRFNKFVILKNHVSLLRTLLSVLLFGCSVLCSRIIYVVSKEQIESI